MMVGQSRQGTHWLLANLIHRIIQAGFSVKFIFHCIRYFQGLAIGIVVTWARPKLKPFNAHYYLNNWFAALSAPHKIIPIWTSCCSSLFHLWPQNTRGVRQHSNFVTKDDWAKNSSKQLGFQGLLSLFSPYWVKSYKKHKVNSFLCKQSSYHRVKPKPKPKLCLVQLYSSSRSASLVTSL